MSFDWLVPLLLSVTALSESHIVLTYPPARYLPSDFLDNVRTKPPCGVPKLSSENSTTLRAGSSFNVTWHLAYPHQGGYKLELLNNNGNLISDLTQGNGFVGLEDQTGQHHEIYLDETMECQNCIIRLLREAREWSGEYQFWSCADVSIVPASEEVSCLNRGNRVGDMCVCDRKFTGDYCQYENDCRTDVDCNGNGVCLALSETSYPQLGCFCNIGWYGKNCENESVFKSAAFDESLYQVKQFGPDNDSQIFWRIIDNREIEVVLRYFGEAWIALGWRPSGLTKSCQRFPLFVQPEVVPRRKRQTLETEPPPNTENDNREKSEYAVPESEAAVPEPNASQENLHPMDCTDIVIGSAVGQFGRVGDYYTRDRSTPMRDEVFGGGDSLTAAAAYIDFQRRTVVMFRKRLETTEKSDHSITDSVMDVIWARGQLNGLYSHRPNSGLEEGTHKREHFYEAHLPRYHGAVNRGLFKLNFRADTGVITGNSLTEGDKPLASLTKRNDSENACSGAFACPEENCDYHISWTITSDRNLQLNLSRSLALGQWTGVGFSQDGTMALADIMVLTPGPEGEVSVTDRFAQGYAEPRLDEEQNFHILTASYRNGILTAVVEKPLSSSDTYEDFDLETSCVKLLFPFGGGPTFGESVGKHTRTPEVSKRFVCFGQCPPLARIDNEIDINQRQLSNVDPDLSVELSTVSTEVHISTDSSTNLEQTTTFGDVSTNGFGTSIETETTLRTSTEYAEDKETEQSAETPGRPLKNGDNFPQLQKLAEEFQSDPKPVNTLISETIGTPAASLCLGTYTCSLPDCNYQVNWNTDPEAKKITIEIESVTPPGFWTGIGFSPLGTMSSADIILVHHSTEGNVVLSDTKSRGYEPPMEDDLSVDLLKSSYENGQLKVSIRRPLFTGDLQGDEDLLTACVFLMYPFAGGPLIDDSIGKHFETPLVSEEKICFNKCTDAAQANSQGTSTATDPQVATIVGSTGTDILDGEDFNEEGNVGDTDGDTTFAESTKNSIAEQESEDVTATEENTEANSSSGSVLETTETGVVGTSAVQPKGTNRASTTEFTTPPRETSTNTTSASGNFTCSRAPIKNECNESIKPQWVLRWYREPKLSECNAYVYSLCRQDDPLKEPKTIVYEQDCYEYCFTSEEKGVMAMFKDLHFRDGFRVQRQQKTKRSLFT